MLLFGGLVIGGVAEKVPERIRRLVYLDAYIPQDNESAFDIIPGLEAIYKERTLKEQGGKWLVASYTPEEFGVTNPDDKWMNPRLSPMPWHTHDQPLRITNPKARKIPKSYICCTESGNAQLYKILIIQKYIHLLYHFMVSMRNQYNSYKLIYEINSKNFLLVPQIGTSYYLITPCCPMKI